MICHSNDIKLFDVFFYKEKNRKKNQKHYFVCIYDQEEDVNNNLKNDVFGLVITTNLKYRHFKNNDYNVELKINEVSCFANCDKLIRVRKIDVEKKQVVLTNQEKYEIKKRFNKFLTELNRQIERKE